MAMSLGPRHLYVAFAPSLGLVKFGISFGPRSRVKDLASERRTRVVLLGERRGTREQERRLHDSVGQWREQGEWYFDSLEVRSAAAKLLRRPADRIFAPIDAQSLDDVGQALEHECAALLACGTR
jgi:hypothetical protein